MIRVLLERLLRHSGLEISRAPRQSAFPPSPQTPFTADWATLRADPDRDPLNPNLHLCYAIDASQLGRPYLAYAELKTAQYLGADPQQVVKLLTLFTQALPNPMQMNHNQYFRFISLSSEIINRVTKPDFSILDVGGGDGELASFIPNASYCLAEPSINGISGVDLPFPDRSFDYVIACHVLEHIPIDRRALFLDQLLSKARHGVILLNPFYVDGTYVDDRLRLVVEVTGAQWAQEHLECTLPRLDDVKRYASDKGLELSIKPNGSVATTMAFIFLDYFAGKSGCHQDWVKVNAFFNERYASIVDSPLYPNSYLIYLGVGSN